MEITGRQLSEHYCWGEGCDGWHLVKTASLSVIEERMPPGTSEVRHYHRQANQFFYVLRGTLSVEIEGNQVELTPGRGIQISPGAAHLVRNQSRLDAEFLVISNPASHGDRVPAASNL
jgi:quercetin dioxygenase-like cupin family protein